MVAGLNCRRLSAIAAAKHWRSAKTAFRVVAAERPLAKRSETHCRTPLLVIARSGASPKRGRTYFCKVVSSRCPGCCSLADHVRWVALLDPLVQTHIAPTWVAPGPSGQRDFDFSLATLGVYQTHLGFAVLLSALVPIAHSVSGNDSKAARAVPPQNATSLDVGHALLPW